MISRGVWSALGWSSAAVVLAGIGLSIFSAVRANQETSYLASDQYLIDKAEASVREKLKDPASAVFSQERIVGSGVDKRVCGFVNAKNSFGGYTGNQEFVTFFGSLAYVGASDRPPPAIWSRKESPCDA